MNPHFLEVELIIDSYHEVIKALKTETESIIKPPEFTDRQICIW